MFSVFVTLRRHNSVMLEWNMKYKFTKLSLRAKIITDTYADLKKAYIVAGDCDSLAKKVKLIPFENFKLPYDFGEDEIRNLIYDCSIKQLSKSVRSAVGGYHCSAKMDCEFTPVMTSDEFEEVKFSNLEKNLSQYSNDRVLSEEERNFIFDYYRGGKNLVKLHSHYLRHCGEGDFVTEDINFKPITLDAMYQVIHRGRSLGKLESRQLDWTSEMGTMAIWIKALEKKDKKYGHLKRVNDTLNQFYGGSGLKISYNKMNGFLDQPIQKEILSDLEMQLSYVDY